MRATLFTLSIAILCVPATSHAEAWSLSPTTLDRAPAAPASATTGGAPWSTSRGSSPPSPSPSFSTPLPIPALAPPARTRAHVVFYGWQNMIVGELGVGLAAIGLAVRSPKVSVPGMILYAVGPPAIHALHGSEPRAWGSVALHTGLPLLGAGIGALAASNLHRNPGTWAVWGLGIGVLSAPLADGLFLGWKVERSGDVPRRAGAAPTFAMAPSPDGHGGSFAVGAAGTF